MTRSLRFSTLFLAAALVASACGPGGSTVPPASGGPAASAPASGPATSVEPGPAGSINVLSLWGGSEEEAFKEVMAAGGCLTLTISLGLFLLAGLVEALKLPIRELPIWRFSPLLPLIPIVVFLVLQLFRLAVPPRKENA